LKKNLSISHNLIVGQNYKILNEIQPPPPPRGTKLSFPKEDIVGHFPSSWG
jgi:hypothetical protein